MSRFDLKLRKIAFIISMVEVNEEHAFELLEKIKNNKLETDAEILSLSEVIKILASDAQELMRIARCERKKVLKFQNAADKERRQQLRDTPAPDNVVSLRGS